MRFINLLVFAWECWRPKPETIFSSDQASPSWSSTLLTSLSTRIFIFKNYFFTHSIHWIHYVHAKVMEIFKSHEFLLHIVSSECPHCSPPGSVRPRTLREIVSSRSVLTWPASSGTTLMTPTPSSPWSWSTTSRLLWRSRGRFTVF